MFRLPLFSKRQTKRSENACSRSLLRSYFSKKVSKKLGKEGKALPHDGSGREGLRAPVYNSGAGVRVPPVPEFLPAFYTTFDDRAAIFNSHDMFVFRCDIFQGLNDPAVFRGKDRCYPFRDSLEKAVITATFSDLNHVKLPLCAIGGAISGMPFQTCLLRIGEIPVGEPAYRGICGKGSHGTEAFGNIQFSSINVEIKVSVFRKQPCPERTDKAYFRADGFPCLKLSH